jgi:hypothetical protein
MSDPPSLRPPAVAQSVAASGTIVIGLGFNGKGKDKNLLALANGASGWYVEVTGRTKLEALAADIWKDLRNRYLLGFVPTAFDGKEHALSVKGSDPMSSSEREPRISRRSRSSARVSLSRRLLVLIPRGIPGGRTPVCAGPLGRPLPLATARQVRVALGVHRKDSAYVRKKAKSERQKRRNLTVYLLPDQMRSSGTKGA